MYNLLGDIKAYANYALIVKYKSLNKWSKLCIRRHKNLNAYVNVFGGIRPNNICEVFERYTNLKNIVAMIC